MKGPEDVFAEEIRRAIPATPRVRLAELSAAVWKGFACGAVSEEDAQQLADEIHARKAIPPTPAAPRRLVGSRPRSPEHMERRRRWTGSGWLPPQVAARFTMAETAVLSVIASEVARRGLCRLTIGHVAVLAGVSRSTVKTAVRQAVAVGILTSEEWRLTAWRSAPNTVRIVSAEWRAWLKMRDRRRAGADHPRQAEAVVRKFRSTDLRQGENRYRHTDDARSTGATTGKFPVVRDDGGRQVGGGGVRSSTTLRITDSSSIAAINREPLREEIGKRSGA